jgi:hypothetical protein
VTAEAGSQALEAREALKGGARGLLALHEVVSGLADLMAHDQLSSAASQVRGLPLLPAFARPPACTRALQARSAGCVMWSAGGRLAAQARRAVGSLGLQQGREGR